MLAPLFRDSDLQNLRICDPACGTGDFLVPVAEEICARMADAPKKARSAYQATLANLTGFDVDRVAAQECRSRLSKTASRILHEPCPESFWNVQCADALVAARYRKNRERYDWVIGNPPYVRVQRLERERREQIKNGGWTFFRGASDLYIIFFELSLRLLKPQGSLTFISPSGWIRNDAGAKMRSHLAKIHSVVSLHDFLDHQIFPGRSVYVCITRISKGKTGIPPQAYRWKNGKFIPATLVQNEKRWTVAENSKRENPQRERTVPLSEIADIHVGIQTLADKIFIIENIRRKGNQIAGNAGEHFVEVERNATRRILKASVMKDGRDTAERVIIYPYDNRGNLIPESQLSEKFPLAYAWLNRNRTQLLARDRGRILPERWHSFGRSVGIKNGFGEKILTSRMNPKPNFQICNDPDALFYSGYCIKPRNGIPPETLLKELNSPNMGNYIKTFSQPYRNGWFSYAKQYIENFPVSVSRMATEV